ncbi:MAG: alpha/beta fold hydrolase [Bdellovibrio sp.]|nr:alpha/beta fold hydrolase [Bdellovibrio sp.]
MFQRSLLLPWISFFLCLFMLQSAYAASAPIIYVHGVGISYHPFEYLVPLKRAFKEKGHTLFIARTPAVESIQSSGDDLWNEVQRLVPSGPFHLIGHSMGGLVARSMLARYDFKGRCLSLTTISTPHRGSKVADWALEFRQDKRFATDIFEIVRKFYNDSWATVFELSTKNMQEQFNIGNQNVPGIRYFSIASYIPGPAVFYTQNPYLLIAHRVNTQSGSPLSDGPVAIESAKWGELLATIPSDHYANTAPIPFGGKIIYKDVIDIIVKNLEKNWP